MANKIAALFLSSILIFVPGCSSANDFVGVYHDRSNIHVTIQSGEDGAYYLIAGDISQGAYPCDSNVFLICISFGMLELIVPVDLSTGHVAEWNNSVVTVEKYHKSKIIGDMKFGDVYQLHVEKNRFFMSGGELKQRAAKDRNFEILYSKKLGLLGFKELPANNEQYFLVNTKTLQARKDR
jgi:hypothetical protein